MEEHTDQITENDIYKIIRKLVNFPYRKICVHSVACDLLFLIEEKGATIDFELAKSIVNADNEKSLSILDKIIK